MKAEVKGTTLPVLEVLLDPGETVIFTRAELSWMSPTLQLTQTTGTGGQHELMAGLQRMAGGGGLFLTRYAASGGPAMVVFAAKMPGRIFPIEIAPGAGFLVHRPGWLCATPGVVPSVGLQQTFRGGLWGATASCSSTWRARARPGSSWRGRSRPTSWRRARASWCTPVTWG